MLLYIMRHGETDWNTELRLQGQTNISLNENGRELARKSSKGLRDIKFDYVFSSPLDRAYETAKLVINDENAVITRDDRLKEIAFGDYEGTTGADRGDDATIRVFFENPSAYVPGGGAESLDSIIARTKAFLEEVIYPIEKVKPEAKIFIAGHGALNKALFLNLLNREKKDYWGRSVQKNCSVGIFEITNGQAKMLEESKIFY